MTADVRASVNVRVGPDVAFAIFTDEIGRWWRPGPGFCMDAGRAIGVRIERGIGGRWLERYDELGDDVFVIGEITAWKPGQSVSFRYRSRFLDGETDVAVRFLAEGDGTRVDLTHGGWDRVDATTAVRNTQQRGWEAILSWFQEWADWGSPLRIASADAVRKGYVLRPGDGVVAGDSSLKASRRSTAGAMTVIESTTTGGAPMHVHAFDDEIFYVLKGVLTVGMDGVTHEIAQGGMAFIPRGLPHEWDTIGEARVLIITAPGGIDEFLHELHTSPDPYPETWARIGPKYGYTML